MVSEFFRKKEVTGLHTAYTLTPLGKDKAETYSSSTPVAEIMSYLNENSSATINEISRELKMNPKKTRLIMKDLVKSGYVMQANTRGG